MTPLRIRPANLQDLDALKHIASDIGTHNEAGYFERCLQEQQDKKRDILIAEQDSVTAGYAQLIWSPTYLPFKRLGIPEIQDLNVIPAARRLGLGRALVKACEQRALQAGKTDIGIAVGLYPSYGAAQRLYAKMGYIPDGAGICHDDIPVRAGEIKPVDDQLTLKFTKKISS